MAEKRTNTPEGVPGGVDELMTCRKETGNNTGNNAGNETLKNIKNKKNAGDKTSEHLSKLVTIGIALSSEKNHDRLMEMIISEARRVTGSDAGTLYLKEGVMLRMKIVHNDTLNIYQGGKGEKVDLPAVPLNPSFVSSYVAMNGEPVNIPDVYNAEGFDFSGACKYDQMTGYKTTSMLVIPLKNHLDEVIGVLQLINALDENSKEIVPFDEEYETIIGALASLAAIALTNSQLIAEIEKIFESFVQVMVTAIDEKTPYNASHARKVSRLACLLAEAINDIENGVYGDEFFNVERMKNLAMAGWLHDIGKIATPLEVMNKATRLDAMMPLVLQRIAYAMEKEMRVSLEKQLQLITAGLNDEARQEKEETEQRLSKLKAARELVIKLDNPGTFVDEELLQQLKEAAALTYINEEGISCKLLKEKDVECLSVPKGTLTGPEREIIEEHVVITEKMLSKIPFTRKLSEVPIFATMHHEFLDGKGYPKGIKGEEIPLEARILAITDVFDALTASDRPYKKKIPEERAVWIIKQMADEGKLDNDLVEIFTREKVWEAM